MEKRKRNTEGGVVKNEKNEPRKGGMRRKGGVVKKGKPEGESVVRRSALELIFRAVERGIVLMEFLSNRIGEKMNKREDGGGRNGKLVQNFIVRAVRGIYPISTSL